jgi:hypothetical protein
MIDCDDILVALLRGTALDGEAARHRATCARCTDLAPHLARVAGTLAAAAAEPPVGLTARIVATAAPLLAANARTLRSPAVASIRPAFDGARLATALLPAVLLFPLLVIVDVALLRALHDALASVLPASLTTYLVLSYGALLGALVCFTFGAIPLLVQRQAPVVWKEGHV